MTREELRRPDSNRIETVLRRLFPATIVNDSVYFEQAVLADSITFNSMGYCIFLITRSAIFYFDIRKSLYDNIAPISIPLSGTYRFVL